MSTRRCAYAKLICEADTGCLSGAGDHVNDLPPGDLAMVLWVYAKLNYNPGAALLDKLAAAACHNVTKLIPVDLSNVVWALGTLGSLPAQALI